MVSRRIAPPVIIAPAVMDVLIHGWGEGLPWTPRTPGWVEAAQMREADYLALWHMHAAAIRAEAARRGCSTIWIEALAAESLP